MITQEFLSKLQNEMKDIQADYEIAEDAQKFAVWVGWKLFDQEPEHVVSESLLYSESKNAALIGYFQDANTVNLVGCWYEESDSPKPISIESIRHLQRLLTKLVKGELSSNRTDEFTSSLKDTEEGVVDLNYYIVTNTETNLHSTDLIQSEGSMEIWGLKELSTIYYRRQHPLRVNEPESLSFAIPNTHIFEGPKSSSNNNALVTLVCALPLGLISKWVSEYGNGLFADNLRFRLTAYDRDAYRLEEKIRGTIKAVPERMFVQNNGITITCANIAQDLEGNNTKTVNLRRPQIVNGCQTSWAIHSTISEAQINNEDPPEGFVLAKIIETEDTELQKKITESSNQQNAIQSRDQKAHDDVQIQISEALNDFTPNAGIYWDYRRGGQDVWSDEHKLRYLIKGTRYYRKISNENAGQIILAMAGAMKDAKNRGGKLFDSDNLYRFAFRYELDASNRFSELENPKLDSGSLSIYVNDLLFGYAIYQYSQAVFKFLYTERIDRLKIQLDEADTEGKKHEFRNMLNQVSALEFVKYWSYDIVRFIHLIAEKWVELKKDISRGDIRKALVGDMTQVKYLDRIFLGEKKCAEWFNLETGSQPNILDMYAPSQELPALGTWLKNLEAIGVEVIKGLKEKAPDVSSRTLILSRKNTHKEIVEHLESKLKSSSFPDLFPIKK